MPGFGFSGPHDRHRLDTPAHRRRALAEIMQTLGYERYGAHGGDWGAMVSSQLGLTDPAHCVGVHLSMVIAPKPADQAVANDVTEQERAELGRMYAAGRDQMGYQRIQSTRPQSLSAGLMDSPIGLAAWIVEKYRAWSDCDGDIETRFTKDELLTNLTIYWVTGTIASANRIYAETRSAGFGASLPDAPVRVPMGYVKFPGDAFNRRVDGSRSCTTSGAGARSTRAVTSRPSRCPSCCPRRSAGSLVASNNYSGHIERNIGPTCPDAAAALSPRGPYNTT